MDSTWIEKFTEGWIACDEYGYYNADPDSFIATFKEEYPAMIRTSSLILLFTRPTKKLQILTWNHPDYESGSILKVHGIRSGEYQLWTSLANPKAHTYDELKKAVDEFNVTV
jgi:hypothetical protein